MRDAWNMNESLKRGSAKTRDGRTVSMLKSAIIDDGDTVLIGNVSLKPLNKYKPGDVILEEKHIWNAPGGFGIHGGDDLITV